MDTVSSSSPIPKTTHRVLQMILSIVFGGLYGFLVIFTIDALHFSGINFPEISWSSQSREIIARVISILIFLIAISVFLSFTLFGNRWFRVLIGHGLIPIIMKYTFISTSILFGIFGVLIKYRAPEPDVTSYTVIRRGFPWEWYGTSQQLNSTTIVNFEYASLFVNFVYWVFVSLFLCAIIITIKDKRT